MFFKTLGIKIKKILKNPKIIGGLLIGLSFSIVFFSPVKAASLIDIGADLISKIFVWVGNIISAIATQIVILEGKFLSLIVDASVFTKMPVVITGWKIARDFANLFFIALLIYVAFGYILRINTKNNQKLLVNIIVMAVLINFSLMIGGIIIDASNVFFNYFIFGPNAGSEEGRGIYLSNALANAFQLNKFFNQSEDAPDPQTNLEGWLQSQVEPAQTGGNKLFMSIIRIFFIIVFSFMVILCLGALVGTLFVRIFMLWILLILAPLAWVANLLPIPAISNLAGKWWGTFLKQCFIAPIIGFFIYLALLTAGNMNSLKFSDAYMSQFNVGLFSGSTNTMFNLMSIMQLVLVIGFLIGGLMVGSQMGDAASKATLAFAKKTGNSVKDKMVSTGKRIGTNAVMGVAGSAANAVNKGLSNAPRGVKMAAALTGLGGLTRNIINRTNKNDINENKKRMGKYENYDKKQLEQTIKSFATEGHEKAAAIAALVNKTDGDIPLEFRDSASNLLPKYKMNDEFKKVMKAHPEWNKKILESANNNEKIDDIVRDISAEFKDKNPSEIKIPDLPDITSPYYSQMSKVREGILKWKAQNSEPKDFARSLLNSNRKNLEQLNTDVQSVINEFYKNNEKAQYDFLSSLSNNPMGAHLITGNDNINKIYNDLKIKEIRRKAEEDKQKENFKKKMSPKKITLYDQYGNQI